MNQIQYAVLIYPINESLADGTSVAFTDSTDTPGAGAIAYTQLTSGQDIMAMGIIGAADPAMVYIPHSSIKAAVIDKAVETVEKPEDANCNEDGDNGEG